MIKFKKKEILRNKKLIERLFNEGYSFMNYPFRITIIKFKAPDDISAKILVTISKKHFKNSVTRNLVRRRIKEAYRNKKDEFYKFLKYNGYEIVFSLSYISNEILDYEKIEKSIKSILRKIEEILKKSTIVE